MQLPYFFEPHIPPANTIFTLSEDTSRHCIQVLRMQAGMQLQLTDGKGNLYTAAITQAGKKHCEVIIQDSMFNRQPGKKIGIAISLLKNAGRFEWFAEKATEMGVHEIVPLLCERTERQHFRLERVTGIIISAMLQSRQNRLPLLREPVTLKKAVEESDYTTKLIAHCIDDSSKTLISALPVKNDAQILIGPEGDFTETEITLALQHQYKPVSLGHTRLRTETAGMVASALLIYP